MQNKNDSWSSGNPYERFMGRWSTLVGKKFLDWLAISPDSSWLDLGCGTGSLTKLILETSQPKEVVGIDFSSEFISYAQHAITNPNVRFQVGLAQELELETNSFDAVVSGIMLNFLPEPETAIAEMLRVTKPGGNIGIYLWDYAEGMEMLRFFWNAAVELDSHAKEYDEGIRFPLCQKGELAALVKENKLNLVEEIPIEVKTKFQDFDDYWKPFLGQVGPAPSYNMELSQQDRKRLENRLRETLPIQADGSIVLKAIAWAVKGTA